MFPLPLAPAVGLPRAEQFYQRCDHGCGPERLRPFKRPNTVRGARGPSYTVLTLRSGGRSLNNRGGQAVIIPREKSH